MLSRLAHGPRIRPLLALGDASGLVAAIWGAHLIRFSSEHFTSKWEQLLASPGLLAWAALSFLGLAVAAELYEVDTVHRFSEVAVRVGVMVLAWSAGLVLATYVWPQWSFGRGLLLLTALILVPLMLAIRWVFTSLLRRRSRTLALVVGDPGAVEQFCRRLAAHPSAPWQPVDGAELGLRDVKTRVDSIGANLVVLAGSELEDREELSIELSMLHFSGVPLVAAVDPSAWLEERLPLESLSPELVLHQPGFGPIHWDVFHRMTSVFDFLLAAFLLVVSLPVLLVSALAIALSDGLPVIYRQERVGRFGRPFKMLKLRTMRRDAEREGPSFAAEEDPRITALGRVLRRLRIDELPQLVNVLRREMALVGPRPERPEYVAELARLIPFYTFRLAVRPGLTGWAQVNMPYARDLPGHRRKLEYDLFYVRQPSIRLYLLTLLRTPNAALVGSRRQPEKVEPQQGLSAPRPPAAVAAQMSRRPAVGHAAGAATPKRVGSA